MRWIGWASKLIIIKVPGRRISPTMGQPRRFVEVGAIVSMFAMTVTMYLVWAVAFVNGDSTAVYIDWYGERFVELLLWTFVIPLVGIGVHSYLRGDASENRDGSTDPTDVER